MSNNLAKLAGALLISIAGITMQLSSNNSIQAAEIAADTIMNIYDVWEVERKREEAIAHGRNYVQLGNYTIRF